MLHAQYMTVFCQYLQKVFQLKLQQRSTPIQSTTTRHVHKCHLKNVFKIHDGAILPTWTPVVKGH